MYYVKLINYLSWILTNIPRSNKTSIIISKVIPKESFKYPKMKRPNPKIFYLKNFHKTMSTMGQIFTNPFNQMKVTINRTMLILINNHQITQTIHQMFKKRTRNQPSSLNQIIKSTNRMDESSFTTKLTELKLT